MNCLLVDTHPLDNSLCGHLAGHAEKTLALGGHTVTRASLYAQPFAPVLTAAERATYYAGPYDTSAVASQAAQLQQAEGLVLVFPTWWFSMPAMLKGWFDRVWGPGIAYDHDTSLGAIQPRLHRLRHVLAITTLGSPWWVDRVVMHRPVRRVLKTALVRTCAPQARFDMLSLYQAERCPPGKVRSFERAIDQRLGRWPR